MSLPVVVQSTGDLPTWIQLLFCNELRKDAFDGGEKWIGSHTFIKVFHSFVAEPLLLWSIPCFEDFMCFNSFNPQNSVRTKKKDATSVIFRSSLRSYGSLR